VFAHFSTVSATIEFTLEAETITRKKLLAGKDRKAEFESDVQAIGPLSERNPATDFATLARLPISNLGG
jgi:hypothetical protein